MVGSWLVMSWPAFSVLIVLSLIGIGASLAAGPVAGPTSRLAVTPLLWVLPLCGALALTGGGAGRKPIYASALILCLLGWVGQLLVCALTARRVKIGILPTGVFLLNVPATAVALLGLSEGLSGASL